jgi:methylmalonyl-CoA/ethylmalonyl-CoA epimerase
MLDKIDHIGIASNDVEAVIEKMQTVFGLTPSFSEDVADQMVRAVGFTVGESKLEFLEPTDAASPIARFLDKKGEGMHHIAFRVKDIHAALAKAKASGMRLIDEVPRKGAEGKLIAFLHPKSLNGMLIELSQED